jgi:hypothetical protein
MNVIRHQAKRQQLESVLLFTAIEKTQVMPLIIRLKKYGLTIVATIYDMIHKPRIMNPLPAPHKTPTSSQRHSRENESPELISKLLRDTRFGRPDTYFVDTYFVTPIL